MKTVKFELEITFSRDIRENQIREVAENIMGAIKRETESGQIAPNESVAYTKEASIRMPDCNIPLTGFKY